MPGMDGFASARRVCEINSTIPILSMTPLDDIGSKQKGFHAGIDDYKIFPVAVYPGKNIHSGSSKVCVVTYNLEIAPPHVYGMSDQISINNKFMVRSKQKM